MSPVHVHGDEVDVVVLGVKQILVVRTVVRIVIDAAQHQTFRHGAEKQVLVRVRSGACGNGVHLVVDGPHRTVRRIQGGLLCEQGGIDDVDLFTVPPLRTAKSTAMSANAFLLRTSRVLTSTPLLKNLSCRNRSMWRRPIMSTTTPNNVSSSSHEPCISRASVGDLCPCAASDSSVA